MLMLVAPIIVEAPFLLKLWLKTVPDYTVLFVRLTLVASLISTLSSPLYTLALATGNIKKYQIVVGSLSLSCFFVTYVCYKLGLPVESAYYAYIIIQVVILVARLKIVSDLTELNLMQFSSSVLSKVVLVSLIVVVILYLSKSIFVSSTFVNSLVIIFIACVVSFISIVLIGLDSYERNFFINLLRSKEQ